MATKRIEELQRYKKELRRQNYGLEVRLQQNKNTTNVPVLLTTNLGSGEVERAHIRFNVVCPPTGIESMLEVLKCLKNTNDTRAIAIQSSLSTQKFSAQFEIETKIGTAEVEKAVNATLWKVGKKYHINSH
ncbi:hypothetical protein Leryth_017180 [Lithospermum erythrorhizon]|nr:hypothetical protein Leryth_017180 [Lithospermum erythrorhizon]